MKAQADNNFFNVTPLRTIPSLLPYNPARNDKTGTSMQNGRMRTLPTLSLEEGMFSFNSAYYEESRASGSEGPDGDEDWTDYENEEAEIGGIDACASPKFRQLVRQKKLELKAQYGKGYFSVGECGIYPLCIWDCSKEKNQNKDCCIKRHEWKLCRDQNRGVWVAGWRRKWREFKRDGGLAQLRLQSKCLNGAPTQPGKKPFLSVGKVAVKAPGTYSKRGESANGVVAREQGSFLSNNRNMIWIVVAILVILLAWFIIRKYFSKK